LVNADWTAIPVEEIYAGLVNFGCPIRLVAKEDGQYTQFRKNGENTGLYIASKQYSDGEPILVSTQLGARLSHDLKPLDGIQIGEGFLPCGSVYTFNSMTGELLYRDQNSELDWGSVNDFSYVSALFPSDCFYGSRGIALDYFGSERLGVLWVEQDFNALDGESKDIVFRERANGVWTNEMTVFDGFLYGETGSLAGNWCDFDYDTDIGIGCAAYEVIDGTERALYAQLYGLYSDQNGNPLWLPDPIWIADIISTVNVIESYVDLDIDNGYIYIAFSNIAPLGSESEAAVYCATLDLLNRP
jgi:hypothetical protein